MSAAGVRHEKRVAESTPDIVDCNTSIQTPDSLLESNPNARPPSGHAPGSPTGHETYYIDSMTPAPPRLSIKPLFDNNIWIVV